VDEELFPAEGLHARHAYRYGRLEIAGRRLASGDPGLDPIYDFSAMNSDRLSTWRTKRTQSCQPEFQVAELFDRAPDLVACLQPHLLFFWHPDNDALRRA
jgi:hypothetical protein